MIWTTFKSNKFRLISLVFIAVITLALPHIPVVAKVTDIDGFYEEVERVLYEICTELGYDESDCAKSAYNTIEKNGKSEKNIDYINWQHALCRGKPPTADTKGGGIWNIGTEMCENDKNDKEFSSKYVTSDYIACRDFSFLVERDPNNTLGANPENKYDSLPYGDDEEDNARIQDLDKNRPAREWARTYMQGDSSVFSFSTDVHSRRQLSLIVAYDACDKFEAGSVFNKACIGLRDIYTSCLRDVEVAKAQHTKHEHGEDIMDQLSEDGPFSYTGEYLNIQDFMEIEFFAKYARAALYSCRNINKGGKYRQYCNQIDQDFKKRLGLIIGLNAHGSIGWRLVHDNWRKSLEESVSFTDMPDAGYNVVEDPMAYNTATRDFDRFVIECRTFSDLSGIMEPISRTEKEHTDFIDDFNNRADMFCSYHNNILKDTDDYTSGVNNLIALCSSSAAEGRCERVVKDIGEGMLSNSHIQSFLLQTMYWNVVDMPPADTSFITWEKLSAKDRTDMNKVIEAVSFEDIDYDAAAETKDDKPAVKQTAPDKDKVPCDVEGGLGWFLCGSAEWLMSSFDAAYKLIANLMEIKTKDLLNDGTREFWRDMANIANVLIILAILVVIFSQLTGVGISNYQAKKLLPKIILVAILVNLSFFVIQILVDASNIAGHGLYRFIDTATRDTGLKEDYSTVMSLTSLQGNIFKSIAQHLINLVVFLLMGIVWLIALIIQVFTLSGRNALVILIAITAPIIAVLYVFPNTKKLVSLWSKALLFVIILYPLMALVFATGRLGFNLTHNNEQFLAGIFSRSLLILPMLASPYLLVKVAKGLPLISVVIGRASNKIRSFVSGQYTPREGSYLHYRRQRLDEIDKQVRTGQYRGTRPFRRLKSAVFRRGLANTALFAQNTAQLQAELSQSRDTRSNLIASEADAMALINNLATNRPIPKSPTNNYLRVASGSKKDMALDAVLGYMKTSGANGTTDIKNFAYAMAVARQYGASQTELQDVYKQALDSFSNSGDFNIAGEMKAYSSYYTDNPAADGTVWGNFDPAMYDNLTDAAGNDTAFTAHRKAVVRSEMMHRVLEQPIEDDGSKITIPPAAVRDGTIGQEVLVREFNTNRDFESNLREQAPSFSPQTYTVINKALGEKLSTPPKQSDNLKK